MKRPLRVLSVEDNAADTELLLIELRRAGFDPTCSRVDTEAGYLEHLGSDLDLILSDYSLPQMSGLRALELRNERGLNIPFIVVSGTIGEETAVNAMRNGASDYLLKDRLARLGQAVIHSLEQARLRRAREQAEAKFRAVFEAANDGIFVLCDGVFVDVNRRGLALAGLSREKLLGSTPEQISPPLQPDGRDSRELAMQKLHWALACEPQFFEWVLLRPDGTRLDVEVSLSKFEINGQKHLQAIVRDITERKQAQEQLAESERRFRDMLKNVGMIAVTLDQDGRITFCNDYLLRTTGWRRAEVLGGDWFANFVPDDPDMKQMFIDTIEGGQIPTYYESQIKTKTGGHRDIVWNNTLLRDAVGKIIGTASLGEDVTERKLAQARVREQADMLNLAHEAIIVREIDTRRITFWNQGAERLYGWLAEEAVGRDIGQLIFADPSAPDTVTERLLEAGEWRGELHHVTKAGKKLIVSGNSTLMRDANGDPKSVLAINIDITERKNLEAQLLRAQRMESIGTLASGVAHDLNNILSPILMSVAVLRKDLSPEQRERILTTIERSAEHGAEIVKQVLTFGSGVAGEKRATPVGGLLDEMAKIIRGTFPKNIMLECTVAPGLWTVMGDATQIHQVLLNLCVNARDAMPEGGTLWLNATNFNVDVSFATMVGEATPGPHVLLQIGDTGTGIPPEVAERIFEPFFTTKAVGVGTGLGLSTVHGIVRNHGGFIKLISEPGSGSIFQIYLPASLTAGDATDLSAAQGDLPDGQGEIVLVVDDEVHLRDCVRTVLEASGFKTLLCADGTEALAIFAKHSDTIAIMLTDLMMPFMDGIALIRAIRKMGSNIPIIASTGMGVRAQLEELRSMDVGILHKPYGADTLVRTIHRALHPPPVHPATPAPQNP